MADSEDVVLDLATPRDAPVLANLLELYAHDLSDTFGLELGPDGRFGYEKLPLYWSEPERRFPFLIRRGTHLAGFALVTQGSPVPTTQRISTWPSSSSSADTVAPE